MRLDARHYAADDLLRDGRSVHVRAIRPDDKERLIEHFRSLGTRSVYFRFFTAKSGLTEAELRRFTEPDFDRHVALVATLRQGNDERIIGVGRYFAGDDHVALQRAEVAFAVADPYQGRGIGTLLLEHLARIARARGVTEFEADTLGENQRMLDVFAQSGFLVTRSLAGGVFHLSFPTAATPGLREASARRERTAAAESIRALLHPRAVAVIGASRRAGTIGATLLANLQSAGFRGPIYPVNPAAREVGGLPAHASVQAIGAPVDLAVVAVPAALVEDALADCARAGVRGVVVISAGFGETASGKEVERRLTRHARASGMRLVGPNCLGILNTDPAVRLDATFAPRRPPAGNVGMLSQSGALGIAVLDHLGALNLGVSSFVSVGNKADVSGNDLLAYWGEDPRTAVIALYLESFGNPRKFARIAPSVARRKPIVAVKSGRSAAGTRAAASHSAALATLDVAVDALFAQAGVIRTDSLAQLFDVVTLLATQPLPAGPRVGVVTNAGGPGILLADACEALGLVLPRLGDDTCARLRALVPGYAGLANPVDLLAAATPAQVETAIGIVGNDPAIDVLVAIYIPVLGAALEEFAAAIARGAGTVPRATPVLAVLMGSQGVLPALATGPRGALPSYPYPENAAGALAAAHRYARWRRRPTGTPLTLAPFARSAIRAVVERVLATATDAIWLAPDDVALVLRAADLTVAPAETVAPEPAAAAAAAARLGFPLVAKAVAPGLVHKTEAGAVLLGLESVAAVEAAVPTLRERVRAAGTTLEQVLLQREVRGGVEALVGVTTDPTFGPLVLCGLGGVLVELLGDVALRLPPITEVDAEEMLDALKGRALFTGYRGMPPADRAALATLLMRVSALVEIVPELRELDLNPVKVLAPGAGVVVVDARLRVAPL